MDDMLTQVVREVQQQHLEFDLELILDVGGAGLLWSDLAAKLRRRPINRTAFRSVRLRIFNTDFPEHFAEAEPSSAVTDSPAIETSSSQVEILYIFLTDGTGMAWQTGDVHRWLRDWRGRGTVLIVHLLPAAMWNRSTLPIEFVSHELSHDEGHREDRTTRTDDGQVAVGPDGRDPARIIPVVELRADSLGGWEPLLKGATDGIISGYALLVPMSDTATPDRPPEGGPREPPTAEERIQRFDVIASAEAKRLVRHLSGTRLELTAMRRVQRDLLPGGDPAVVAEILLGGLVYRAYPSVAEAPTAPPEKVIFKFHPGVDELLAEQLANETLPSSPTSNISLPRLVPAAAAGLEVADRPSTPDAKLQIAFWGSSKSGKTTFLAILQHGWWPSSKEEWNACPEDRVTKELIKTRYRELTEGKHFPLGSLNPEQLNFTFKRRPRRLMRRSISVANLRVGLQDIPGSVFNQDRPHGEALDDLVDPDAILYFFDVTYDAEGRDRLDAYNFFLRMETRLRRRAAARKEPITDPYLPYHLAMCIPKLDHPIVFNAARRYGCLQTDPETDRPWVPDRHARRLFEALCRAHMRTPESENLLDQLRTSFHPDRISFHVLSSTGFWAGKDREFNPNDFCNVEIGPDGNSRLRGKIDPVHVVDPLVAVIERANQARGWAG